MANPNIVKCNACGGIYRRVLDDGTEYFHACPTQRLVTPATIDPETLKETAPAVFEPLPNRRDENVTVDAKGTVGVKRGDPLGFTPVTDPVQLAALGLTEGNR